MKLIVQIAIKEGILDELYSPVAQLVEQMAVNHRVRGSSPRWGANIFIFSLALRSHIRVFSYQSCTTSHILEHSSKYKRFWINGLVCAQAWQG